MTRYPAHFVAAFAAIAITIFSMQVITTVPSAQLAVVETPALA